MLQTMPRTLPPAMPSPRMMPPATAMSTTAARLRKKVMGAYRRVSDRGRELDLDGVVGAGEGGRHLLWVRRPGRGASTASGAAAPRTSPGSRAGRATRRGRSGCRSRTRRGGCASRVTSNASGSWKTRSSRLADEYMSRARRRRATCCPCSSWSSVAVPLMLRIGVTQRMNSSTPVAPMIAGSSRSSCRWSGCADELEAHRADHRARRLGAAVEQEQRLLDDLAVGPSGARCRRGTRRRSAPTPR